MAWGGGDGGQGRANLERWENVRDDVLREEKSRHSYENAEDSVKHSIGRASIYLLIGIIVVALLIGLVWFVF